MFHEQIKVLSFFANMPTMKNCEEGANKFLVELNQTLFLNVSFLRQHLKAKDK
jgi:hypothetical protein